MLVRQLRVKPGPKGLPPRTRSTARPGWAALVLLAPATIVMVLVVGYPLVRMVITSFQDFGLQTLFNGRHPFIGLHNYTAVFSDPAFWPTVVRTLVFTAALVIGTVVIGMGVSELMTRVHPFVRSVMSVVMVVAWAVPTVASTILWEWLFEPLYGVCNWLLTQVGIFGNMNQHIWFANSIEAFFVVWLLIVWQAVPFVALTLYAAQSQIPSEYFEAARMDRASGWQIYRQITVPFLRGVLALIVVMSIVWDFNAFNQIWILTQGGPDSGTTTIAIWTYQVAFANNSYGYASAIAVVTLIVLMCLSAFHIRRMVRETRIL
jgi:N,N'-diacetylchitobiose transport system permease protein